MQQYTYSHVHGRWPTPGSSSYGVNSTSTQQGAGALQTPGGSPYPLNAANGTQPPMGTTPYTPRSVYGQPYSAQRSTPSPTTTGEASYEHHGFQSSASQDNHSSLPTSLPSVAMSQPPAMANTPSLANSAGAHQEPYGHGRSSISAPSYAPSSSAQGQPGFSYAPQHSPNNHSSTGAAPLPRGLGSLSGQHPLPSLEPPTSYRAPYPTYHSPMGGMGGPIMSNIHQPGSQLSMIPGMVPTYGGPGLMYPHPPPQSQPERPFKCDQAFQERMPSRDTDWLRAVKARAKRTPRIQEALTMEPSGMERQADCAVPTRAQGHGTGVSTNDPPHLVQTTSSTADKLTSGNAWSVRLLFKIPSGGGGGSSAMEEDKSPTLHMNKKRREDGEPSSDTPWS